MDAKSSPRARVGAAIATLILLAAGCGGESPAPDAGTPDAAARPDASAPTTDGGLAPADATPGDAAPSDGAFPFAPEEAWGAVGAELPVGAEMIDPEAFAALVASGTLDRMDPAAAAAALAREAQLDAEARALVEARMAGDPRLTRWFPPASVPLPPDLEALPSGGYAWHAPSGDEYILDDERTKLRDLAYSLRETNARGNLEARYGALYGSLPGDARAELPAPDALAPLTDDALTTALRTLEARLSTSVPRPITFDSATGPDSTGCTDTPAPSYLTLSARENNPGWQLRADETAVRSQARRGTCAVHAIVAGLEVAVRRKYGVDADFSEQELYANAKGQWFPAPLDFLDGLPTASVIAELRDRAFRVDAEARWPYNSSSMRQTDEVFHRYSHSCDDYPAACSDTNHQQRRVCTTVGSSVFCAWSRPSSVDTTSVGNVRITQRVSLWNPLEPENSLAAIRAHLDARHPVVIGASIGPSFRFWVSAERADRGFVQGTESGGVGPQPDDDQRGGHALLAVGYIPNALLPEDLQLYPPWDGNGVLVLKNSWGCRSGDKGHAYVGYAWAAEALTSATAIVDVAASVPGPTISLTADRSNVTAPVSVRFEMVSNRGAVRVELFEGLGSTTPIFARDIASPADGTTTAHQVPLTAADNGLHVYVAHALDVFGHVVASSIVGVLVNIDNVDPTVTLTPDRLRVVAPAAVALRANATDMGGIARVQFLEGLSTIGIDTSAPYARVVWFDAADVGVHNFAVIATDNSGNQRASNIVSVTVVPRASPPVINQFTATPAQLPAAGGTVTLDWLTSGARGVRIEPTVGRSPTDGQATLSLLATTTFTLTATNSVGTTTQQLTVVVAADTTPPTITLSPSSTFIAAPDTLTLTANAQDDVGVTEVEFFRDGTSAAIDTTPADGFQATVALTLADAGAHAFTAVARDAAGHATTSAAVTVTVSAGTDVFVSPTGTDAGNTTCLLATPCRTIAYAATRAPAGSAVILLDGTYDTTTQGAAAITIPSGVSVRARNDRQAIVKCVLSLAGSGSVIGVRIDRTAPNVQAGAGIRASAGTVLVESVDWVGAYSAVGSSEGLRVTGTAVVTVRPGLVADYSAQTVAIPSTASVIPFFSAANTAELRVEGGVFGGPGLGAPPTTPNGGAGAAMLVRDTARLVLQDVQLSFNTHGVAVIGDGHLEATRTTFHPTVATNGSAIHLESNGTGPVPSATLTNSTISGASGAQHLRHGVRAYESGTSARLTLSGSTIEQCQTGVTAALGTALQVTANNAIVRDNVGGGVTCDGTCNLDFTGGSVTNNATDSTLASFGGLFFGGTLAHAVRLRGVQVTGNRSATSNGNTNRNDNSGVVLRGGAAAVFDLGTAADPGNNTFRDNISGANTANVFVAANAGVTVSAVGNSWEPSVQGADAAGHYVGAVLATMGAGVNYRVSSGALLLSQ